MWMDFLIFNIKFFSLAEMKAQEWSMGSFLLPGAPTTDANPPHSPVTSGPW